MGDWHGDGGGVPCCEIGVAVTVTVHPTAKIECDNLALGDGTIIRAHAELYGRRIVLGRDSFVDEYAVIGGGSAEVGEFVAGDWLHMGMFSQVNIARPVHVGDEVGIGISTRIFTHGAYLSEWDGFPVQFESVTVGSRVWLPQATVMPGVTVGDDVVVAAGSVVTKDVPSGCLAAGTPARVIRGDVYPSKPEDRQAILERIIGKMAEVHPGVVRCGHVCPHTCFWIAERVIDGPVTNVSERVRNELRRHGIRFPYSVVDGEYQRWADK